MPTDATRATAGALPDISCAAELEHIHGEVIVLTCQLHLLMANLEQAFKLSRAAKRSEGIVTFNFQEDGVDATLWLASEAFSRVADLRDRVRRNTDILSSEVEARSACYA